MPPPHTPRTYVRALDSSPSNTISSIRTFAATPVPVTRPAYCVRAGVATGCAHIQTL
jgi:hypothetical protein